MMDATRVLLAGFQLHYTKEEGPQTMNSIELKIKAMSLCSEIRIIRAQEQKLTKRMRRRKARAEAKAAAGHVVTVALEPIVDDVIAVRSIRAHRLGHGGLREDARATEWARAFIAGKPYRLIENESSLNDDLSLGHRLVALAASMVLKYGTPCQTTGRPGDNRHPKAVAIEKILNWITVPIEEALKAKLIVNKAEAICNGTLRRAKDAQTHASERARRAMGVSTGFRGVSSL